MKIDPSKTVMPNLLLLLSEANPSASVLSDQTVTFSDPVAFNDPSGISNTKITVTAIKNKGYSDSVTIAYRRVTFDQAYPTMAAVWPISQLDTSATVMSRLTAGLGALSGEFIVNSGNSLTLPTTTTLTTSTSITAKPNSKIFLPGTSKAVTLKMGLPIVEVTYAQNGNNLNTLTLLNNPTAVADYRLTVTGIIGSTTAATAALTVGELPSGSIMTLLVKGTIQGKGGKGGDFNTPGGSGGPAIKAMMNFYLHAGGGKVFGGGGGGGGCNQVFGALNANWLRSAGGGGSGANVGAAGTGTAIAGLGLQTNNAAASGTGAAGGVGAKTSSMSDATQYSQGGTGGSPGSPGSPGVAAKGTSTATVTNFPGGAAGKAVDLAGRTVTIIAGNDNTQIKGLVA